MDISEKKIIPIKFYVDQFTYESIIKYANKNEILIPDLMRLFIENKFIDGTLEKRFKEKPIKNLSNQAQHILSFNGLDGGESF